MVAVSGPTSVTSVTGAPTPTPDRCDSCGETAALTLIRRVYLPLDLEQMANGVGGAGVSGAGVSGSADDLEVALGDLEWWCEVCRVHYPHQDGPTQGAGQS